MSEMIERVAKELFLWQYGHTRWEMAEPEEREDVLEAARAVIEVIDASLSHSNGVGTPA